jgi:hypothetical protein
MAWFLDMFGNLYFVKNLKLVNTSTITKAKEKISPDVELWNFRKKLIWVSINLKKIKF